MREIEHDEGHRWFRSSVVDEEAVDHERQIGAVAVAGDIVRVRVAQRVGFDLLAEPIGVCPSPPRITLGETFEMTAQQALDTAELLRVAAHFVHQVDGQWPRLVAEA